MVMPVTAVSDVERSVRSSQALPSFSGEMTPDLLVKDETHPAQGIGDNKRHMADFHEDAVVDVSLCHYGCILILVQGSE